MWFSFLIKERENADRSVHGDNVFDFSVPVHSAGHLSGSAPFDYVRWRLAGWRKGIP
jgi:hypothetical protein